jgi:predicted RecB family nuclease
MTGTRAITSESFARFLRCELEAHLHLEGTSGADREFTDWQERCREHYKQAALAVLRSRYQNHETQVGIPPTGDLKRKRWPLIIDGIAESPELRARLDAVELARSPLNGTASSYRPIRFVSSEKVVRSDRLLLAFDALALSRITGVVPPAGRIIYSRRHAVTTVPLAKLIREVRGKFAKLVALGDRAAPPQTILNKHCAGCEFRSRCQTNAVEKDDLSLLTTLKPRARKAWNDKGIFTVTQLSYAFRPRRASKRHLPRSPKHDPALKALAVRTSQIHVVGTPRWTDVENPVYLDVEGVPDQEFYYLIGLR